MAPPQHRQRLRLQALDTDGDAVDPGLTQHRESRGFDAGRVGFQRNFQIGRGIEQRPRVLQQQRHRFRVHQTGRAAPEEDGAQGAAPQTRGLPRQFPAQGIAEPRLGDDLADMGVEVAIRAARQAERPVDVKREGLGRHQTRR